MSRRTGNWIEELMRGLIQFAVLGFFSMFIIPILCLIILIMVLA